MRVRGSSVPVDPDPDLLRLPVLAVDADEQALLDHATRLCAESCDREVVHFAFLAADGRQLAPAGRLHGVPRLPRRPDVDELVDLWRHQGLRVRARQMVCVWQTVDDDRVDRLAVDVWASGIARSLGAGPLRLRAFWHRTPSGFTVPDGLRDRAAGAARD
ncbi:hypothetical protein ITJ55_00950 [Frigoribacterium sp. VKM Ac-1396]|uniref:hypothetical protein n=1 Tax=Frigoribacterium sp. VKM Ac-1396 TaxID=2783821 RepID=UPI00188D3228|nr:hypothetical protein [Frigoribacterium sp. VKM Ac-1396]MBF4599372.1 hypothetical protein [Frigoribacterium sp. VKM Ac-1396]